MYIYRIIGGRYDGQEFAATIALGCVRYKTGHIYVRTDDPPEPKGPLCILRMRPASDQEQADFDAGLGRLGVSQ